MGRNRMKKLNKINAPTISEALKEISPIAKKQRDKIQKAYWEANKDKIKAYNKAYYQANKDKIKAYYQAHKDKKKAYQNAYYHKTKSNR